MARKKVINILSFTQNIISLYFNLFIANQLCYILLNQGKYEELNVIGSVNPGLLIIYVGAGYLYSTGEVLKVIFKLNNKSHIHPSIHE